MMGLRLSLQLWPATLRLQWLPSLPWRRLSPRLRGSSFGRRPDSAAAGGTPPATTLALVFAAAAGCSRCSRCSSIGRASSAACIASPMSNVWPLTTESDSTFIPCSLWYSEGLGPRIVKFRLYCRICALSSFMRPSGRSLTRSGTGMCRKTPASLPPAGGALLAGDTPPGPTGDTPPAGDWHALPGFLSGDPLPASTFTPAPALAGSALPVPASLAGVPPDGDRCCRRRRRRRPAMAKTERPLATGWGPGQACLYNRHDK